MAKNDRIMVKEAPQSMRDGCAAGSGAVIGALGGLIGLGGAEFRLPVLVELFRLRLLPALVINLVVSLVTVAASLVFRIDWQHLDRFVEHWPAAVNLLCGSLVGAYLGARYATRVPERVLAWSVVVLLVGLSVILVGHDWLFAGGSLEVALPWRIVLGCLAGLGIGAVSSMLGVAGGELIIPTLVLLFGLDIKTAGSVSLVVSLPTILVGLNRYRRQSGFAEVSSEKRLIVFMAAGSVLGAWIGSRLLPFVSGSALHVCLGVILLLSAWKMIPHRSSVS